MAQFEVGGKCVCVADSWITTPVIQYYGPKKHEVVTVANIFIDEKGDTMLDFAEYTVHPMFPDCTVSYIAEKFRPLESWPDLQQSAVEETVSHIHELQPA